MLRNTILNFIGAIVIVLAAANMAVAQRVQPPASGSTGNICYESCMRKYTEASDRCVSARAANQCQSQCNYAGRVRQCGKT
jgi:hypothetical protein